MDGLGQYWTVFLAIVDGHSSKSGRSESVRVKGRERVNVDGPFADRPLFVFWNVKIGRPH